MRLVNTELLFNPANWIIVYLMVAFAVLAFTIADPLAATGATSSET